MKKQVFTGTVKRCNDIYWYNEYGEERYVPEFRVGHMEVGSVRRYTETLEDDAVLVRVGNDQYIWLDMVKTLADEIKVELGISNLVIYGTPFYDGALFVDEATLLPYFKSGSFTDMSIGKLKKTLRR